MKTVSSAFQTHLDQGSTALCWCWRVTRNDGQRFGFTDHDHDLVFDGTTFEAASGFTASEIRDSVGLGVDDLAVEGALVSSRLSETSLAAGDFDDAAVEIWRVVWMDTTQRVLMRSGSIGEVRRTGSAFVAEIRGLAHYLQQPNGRLFQYGCDADLGDARCGIDLALATWRGTGVVTTLASDRVLIASGLVAFTSGWFTRGLLTVTSGGNAGRRSEIRRHVLIGGQAHIELWQPLGEPLAPGDAFVVTAGCDKQFTTCRTRFANAARYRGFPHMPGNDFLSTPAIAGT